MAGTWVFTEDERFVVSDDVGMLELFTYNAQLADNVPDARLSLLRRLAPRRVHRTYLQHQHPPSILRMFRTRRIIMRTQFNFVYTSKNQALKAKAHKIADLQKRQEAQRSPRDRAMPIATQQCRNYLYDKSWPNRWYEVGDLVGGNAW